MAKQATQGNIFVTMNKTNTNIIANSALLCRDNGRIYHLDLLPSDLADLIILVGDPQRVPLVSKHFDQIELTRQHREFITHTGYIKQQRITVISTGMGTGNIDIVMNELDALVNVDFDSHQPKPTHKALTIVRVGTTGAAQADINVDSLLISDYAVGADGLMQFYQYDYSPDEQAVLSACQDTFARYSMAHTLYVAQANKELSELIGTSSDYHGTTFTCSGFYGPQGRQVRAPLRIENFLHLIQQIKSPYTITNFEMETAAIYALGRLLGHRCLSVNAVIVNRALDIVSTNMTALVEHMIEQTLTALCD